MTGNRGGKARGGGARGNEPRKSVPRGRRWLVPAGVALVAVVAVATFMLVRPGAPSTRAWSRLGTEDVHSLAFVDGNAQRLLFGHHGGILATSDGGKTWEPLGTRSDAMSLGVAGGGSIVIAGHEVLAESRDGGQTWVDIPADLPSLDIHGFARDPGDPARMWVYLAIGGLWESLDSGRTWQQIQEQNVVFPVAIATPSGTGLVGVTATGIGRSDDGGRTWRTLTDPQLYPVTALASTSDGSILIAGGPDRLARSDDGGVTWSTLPFEGKPAVVAVTEGGSTIALVTRSTEFYRSDDGGLTWPGP
ncbi:MAG: YCF48-related protein [Chloroflexota bacterium]